MILRRHAYCDVFFSAKIKVKAWANRSVGRPNRSQHQYLTYSETIKTSEIKTKKTSIYKRVGSESITVPKQVTENIRMKDFSNFPRQSNKAVHTQLANSIDASRYASAILQLAEDLRSPWPRRRLRPPAPHHSAPGARSIPRQTNPTAPHTTDKRPIPRQEPPPRPPLEGRQGTHPPLPLCECRPLPGDPVPHQPVVPGGPRRFQAWVTNDTSVLKLIQILVIGSTENQEHE